jgi:hypothetical protein
MRPGRIANATESGRIRNTSGIDPEIRPCKKTADESPATAEGWAINLIISKG